MRIIDRLVHRHPAAIAPLASSSRYIPTGQDFKLCPWNATRAERGFGTEWDQVHTRDGSAWADHPPRCEGPAQPRGLRSDGRPSVRARMARNGPTASRLHHSRNGAPDGRQPARHASEGRPGEPGQF
jgi:hypothetical protein